MKLFAVLDQGDLVIIRGWNIAGAAERTRSGICKRIRSCDRYILPQIIDACRARDLPGNPQIYGCRVPYHSQNPGEMTLMAVMAPVTGSITGWSTAPLPPPPTTVTEVAARL